MPNKPAKRSTGRQSNDAKLTARPAFKEMLARVQRQHPRYSLPHATAEAKKRVHDQEANPPAKPAGVVRVSRPSRVAPEARVRAVAERVRPAGHFTIADATLLRRLTGHLPSPLPPFSVGGVVAAATKVRGESVRSWTLAPGEKLCIVSDPYCTGFGWACKVPVGASLGQFLTLDVVPDGDNPDSALGLGNYCLSNPYYLPATLPTTPPTYATAFYWDLIQFTQNPFQVVGTTPSSLYTQWEEANQEFACGDPFRQNAAYVNVQGGHVALEIIASWDASGRHFGLGMDTNGIIFGTGSGMSVTNDDNPTDSAVVCANPATRYPVTDPLSPAQYTQNTILASLEAYVVPDIIMGAAGPTYVATNLVSPNSDKWVQLGSTVAATTLVTPFTTTPEVGPAEIATDSRGFTGTANFLDTAPCAPPMAYFTDRERVSTNNLSYFVGSGTGTDWVPPTSAEQLDNIFARYGFTVDMVGARALSVNMITNDGSSGSIVVVMKGSMDYGMVQQPKGPLGRFNKPIIPYSDPVPRGIGSHSASAKSPAEARVKAVEKAEVHAASKGWSPNFKAIWNVAKTAGKLAMDTGAASGLMDMALPAVIGMAALSPAAPIADVALAVGPAVNAVLRKIPFVKKAENYVVRGIENTATDVFDDFKSWF